MPVVTNWSKYPNFTPGEMACKHTGLTGVQVELMDKLQELRRVIGKPLVVTSGYRHPDHPEEAKKAQPGWHAHGLAVDIACTNPLAFEIVKAALAIGFTGIGISQRAGLSRFVHLDLRDTAPVIYSY